MFARLRLTLTTFTALVVLGTAGTHAQTAATSGSTQLLDAPGGKIRVVTVATGLFHPWSLAFLPDGAVLVA